MTQEEKGLLLKELCARASYGVKVWRQGENYVVSCIDIEKQRIYLKVDFDAIHGWWWDIEEVKPYLRPMSSMTEEELKELNDKYGSIAYFFIQDPPYYHGLQVQHSDIGSIEISEFSEIYDWLDAHHFDYRGLIEKGLALEAKEGMYEIQKDEEDIKIEIPKNLEEALSILNEIVPDEDKEYLKENGAISAHFSLGMWIRNNFGLWENSEFYEYLFEKGFTHPDDMSNYVIEEFIKTL